MASLGMCCVMRYCSEIMLGGRGGCVCSTIICVCVKHERPTIYNDSILHISIKCYIYCKC